MNPGDRIGIIATVVHSHCEFIGWGTYLGRITVEGGRSIPQLLLDTGEEVLGYEFWWGPEKDVLSAFRRYETVQEITLTNARNNRV